MSEDIKEAPQPVDISKAESNPTPSQTRMKFAETGQPFMKEVGGWIRDQAKYELQFPRSIQTFAEMRNHAVVDAGATVGEVFLTKSLLKGRWVAGDSKFQRSQDAASFLNWNLKNLDGGWYDVITNMITCFQNGFSWQEKVFAKNNSQEWDSKFQYKIKKIAPRSADSVQEWVWNDAVTKRDLIGLKQYKSNTLNNPFNTINTISMTQSSSNNVLSPIIPLEKVLLLSWNSTNGNPQGKSDFVGCYKSYKELSMIESLELLGLSKELAGVLVIRMPTEHMHKAAEDPTSPEAIALGALKKQCGAIQQGDQTFIILGSDVQGDNGNGKYVYDMALQGIDGGTGNNNTKDVIAMKEKSILNSFAAGFLTLGDSGVGSYSLADTKQSLHAFYMERKLMFIADALQRQIAKPLLEINQYMLSESEMPIFEYGELDDADADVASKAAQRLGSVALFPKHKGMLIQLWRQCGFDPIELEDREEDEIIAMLTDFESRSGDGMAEGMPSGTGSAKGNNSATNMDNAP
tara:strand:- start:66035 stop:67591 length:1557 start_codon:yes stop_codon:yes gene_type:complete